ncbi:uncharacterized protein [Macrobrachium rosenbergii]|uniref:uncharacterized protein n=1 Tax=Macrobrachium rosenbergii TaxID=79674 RepID=UPI0034D408F2
MTANLLAEKFVWHGMQKIVTAWVRQWIRCQTSKIGHHTETGVGEFPQPGRCWISRFGVPDHITTDRGPAFLFELWPTLAHLLGTSHHTTTTYNPAANGLVERFHRSLKASLMARCTAEGWKYLLGLRTAPRANGDLSAAEKIYGEPLLVLGELITGDRHNPSVQRLHDIVGKFAPCQRTYTDRSITFTPPGLSSTTHVFVRDKAVRPPLTRPHRGPFHVLKRNTKAFRLALHGKDNWVLVDCLKPALLEETADGTTQRPPREPSPPQLSHPKRRSHGRPRKQPAKTTASCSCSHRGTPS